MSRPGATKPTPAICPWFPPKRIPRNCAWPTPEPPSPISFPMQPMPHRPQLLPRTPTRQPQRLALFELALAAQDDNQLLKAQQVFSQYINNYPEAASAPEVLLRQGLLY